MQRRLIVAAGILGLVTVTMLVYAYERHYRGPGENVLFGTWADPDPEWDGRTFYYRLHSDHTFEFLSDLHDEESILVRGRWHAAGDVVFFSLRLEDAPDRKLLVWRIDHISADELRIRYNPRGGLHVCTRVALNSPGASNQIAGANHWPP